MDSKYTCNTFGSLVSGPGLLFSFSLMRFRISIRGMSPVCQMSLRAGASVIKTSTGYGPYGAREADIRLIRNTVGAHLDIKAAGGIRTYGDAMRMIEAGANFVGTSAAVAILEDAPND